MGVVLCSALRCPAVSCHRAALYHSCTVYCLSHSVLHCTMFSVVVSAFPPQYLVAAAEQRRRFRVTGVLLDHAELGLSPPTSPRRLLQQQEKQRKQVGARC